MGREVRRDEGFAARLSEAMRRRDIRPGELAKAQEVSPGTVSRWRAGECPDDLRFPSLATYLKVPEEWLKTGAGPSPVWGPGDVPKQPRNPSRRTEDLEAAAELQELRLRRDGTRLEILARLLRSQLDEGEVPSLDILREWYTIARANRITPPGEPPHD